MKLLMLRNGRLAEIEADAEHAEVIDQKPYPRTSPLPWFVAGFITAYAILAVVALLGGCTAQDRLLALRAVEAAARVVVHDPTPEVPYRWTTELRPEQETLYHQGEVIAPAPEVFVNGRRQ